MPRWIKGAVRQGQERAADEGSRGLALVRQLVELHGETVSAFSAGPGKGSEFTVRLPGFRGSRAKSAVAQYHWHSRRARFGGTHHDRLGCSCLKGCATYDAIGASANAK